MRLEYDPIQTANVAPYLELMQKQQQQPMIDALNRLKLQEGMLNMGSLEYKARKEAKDESDRKNALATLQNYIVDKPTLNGEFYDSNGKPITTDTPGRELRKSLDKGGFTAEGIKQGYDPKILAEIMKEVGEASGMNMEEKQGNALEIAQLKSMFNEGKAEHRAQLAEDKFAKSEYHKNDPEKTAEDLAQLVSTDWLPGDADRNKARDELLRQLSNVRGDAEKFEIVKNAFRDSVQKDPETADWIAALVSTLAGAKAGAITGGVLGSPIAPMTAGTSIPITAGLGGIVGGLGGLITGIQSPLNKPHGSLTGDRDLDMELFLQKLQAAGIPASV